MLKARALETCGDLSSRELSRRVTTPSRQGHVTIMMWGKVDISREKVPALPSFALFCITWAHTITSV